MASVQEAIAVLRDEGQPIGRRCLAVKAICLLGELEQRDPVMRWLGHPVLGRSIDWAERRRLRERERTGAELGEWLIGLAEDPEMLDYWEDAKRIGALRAKRATRRVMRVVRESAEPNRRAAALHALWLLADLRATALCLRVAVDATSSEKERTIAVEALGVSAHRPRVQTALARFLSDPLPMVRYSALCAIGAAWATGGKIGPELREALIRATLDTTRVYEDGDIACFASELLTPMQYGTFGERGSSE